MKYFKAVFVNQSFTKAAEKLHISQPTLSTQIKELEKEFGCILFERHKNAISLTEQGELLLRLIEPILLQEKIMQQEMEDVKTIGLKEINIGIFPSQVYFLPKIISKFRRKYPVVTINIHEMGATDIEDSLIKYDIHLGFTSPIKNSEHLVYLPVYNEDLYLITSKVQPMKHAEYIKLSDLSEEAFITYKKGYSLREIFFTSCSEAGFKPNIMYECGRLETVRQLVIAGMGVAVVPENYIRFTSTKNLSVIKIKNSNFKRPLHIAMNKNRYYPPPVHYLRELFVDFFNEILVK